MKPDLILLHGALGSKAQLSPLAERLKGQFTVHSFNFEGHGDVTTDGPLQIKKFANNLSAYITDANLDQPNVFGYSMGGYVALFAEANNNGLLGKIMTLGTKFNWTPESSAKEVRMLNPVVIEEKVPKFAAHLSNLHAPNDWKINMEKTAKMMEEMGENPPLNSSLFSEVKIPVLLTRGGQDQMVSHEETVKILEQLPEASTVLFPEFQHPIEKVDLGVLSNSIAEFF